MERQVQQDKICNIQIRVTESVILTIDEMRSGMRPIPTRQDFIRGLIETEAAKMKPAGEAGPPVEPKIEAPTDLKAFPRPSTVRKKGRRDGFGDRK
jgi:hypothetical protein